ncbi:thiol-disulfide oxidoreductase DCC family protein [Ectobacillus ponti]|uniref:DUF393 domain-containing protein n=1 Tax=Ectobacillus ponti TaxID=2961894 RepID=A0AA42BPN6_9BACI|nr:DUF393 domain-containing protein [Ectobacillus ponti]MCP8968937.1 DUF393 domain-containing protein [Ectobacillus ponti]
MLTVFYDGWCPLCTGIAERTRKLDVRNATRFVSFRERAVIEEYGLTREQQERMNQRMFAYDGKWHEGIGAVYALACQIPAYWAAVPFLKLSLWTGTGQPLYDWIAARRKIVPVGHCENGACSLEDRKGRR